MKVTCITPSTPDRAHFNDRIKQIFEAQDYADKEHIILLSPGLIGDKRNQCVSYGTGEIILHLDSDDIYAPDWISKSVAALTSSAVELTGLSNAYFYVENGRLMEYTYRGGQPYTIGAAMCYWRKAWEREPFKSVHTGEDMLFCIGKSIKAHTHKESFVAIIHGANTCGHHGLIIKEMRAVPLSTAPDILKKYYPILLPLHSLL